MGEVQVAHTSALESAVLEAAFDLLVDVFEGDLSADDWEHALGGVHALVWDGANWSGTRPSCKDGCCTEGGRCGPGTWRASGSARTGGGAGTAG